MSWLFIKYRRWPAFAGNGKTMLLSFTWTSKLKSFGTSHPSLNASTCSSFVSKYAEASLSISYFVTECICLMPAPFFWRMVFVFLSQCRSVIGNLFLLWKKTKQTSWLCSLSINLHVEEGKNDAVQRNRKPPPPLPTGLNVWEFPIFPSSHI